MFVFLHMDIYKDTCLHKYLVRNLALRFARPCFVEGQVPSILHINLKTSFHIATFKDKHKKQRQPPKTSTWISISWYRCDRIRRELECDWWLPYIRECFKKIRKIKCIVKRHPIVTRSRQHLGSSLNQVVKSFWNTLAFHLALFKLELP